MGRRTPFASLMKANRPHLPAQPNECASTSTLSPPAPRGAPVPPGGGGGGGGPMPRGHGGAWGHALWAAGAAGLCAGLARGGCVARFDVDEGASPLLVEGQLTKPLPVPAALVTPGQHGLSGALFAEFDVEGACPAAFGDLLRQAGGVRFLAVAGMDAGEGRIRLYPRQLDVEVALASLKVADLRFSDFVLRLSSSTAGFSKLEPSGAEGAERFSFKDAPAAAEFPQGESTVQIHFPSASNAVIDQAVLISEAKISGEFRADPRDEKAGTLTIPPTTLSFPIEDGVLADDVEATLDFTVALVGSTVLGCSEGCLQRGKCSSGTPSVGGSGGSAPTCFCECGYSGDDCSVSTGFCSPYDSEGTTVAACPAEPPSEPAVPAQPGREDSAEGAGGTVDACTPTRRVYDNFYTGVDCKEGELWDPELCSCICGGDIALEGFKGGFCDVCDRDEACVRTNGAGSSCDKSLAVTATSAEKSFFCDVVDREALGLRGNLHSHCDLVEGVCTLKVGSQLLSWFEDNQRDPAWYADLAHWTCTGTECVFSEGGPGYECQKVDCECTDGLGCPDYFKPFVTSMFRAAEGPMIMECTADPDYCKLKIEGMAVQPEGPCTAGTCSFGSTANVNFKSTEKKGLDGMAIGAIAIVTVFSLFFSLLWSGSALSRQKMATLLRSHAKMGREDAALSSLLAGNALVFSGITGTVPVKNSEAGMDSHAPVGPEDVESITKPAMELDRREREELQKQGPGKLLQAIPRRRGARGTDRVVLSGVRGHLVKGEVTGIMGPSGSGKSTLINFLAGATAAGVRIHGEVTVDGRARGGWFRRIAAHVPQETTLIETLTVRECLLYSALLRLPWHWPRELKGDKVEQVLKELNLGQVARTRVGSVSGGEQRRASIGMELVTSPNILFLDEPTSGLDSHTAAQIMRTLTELARRGRMVCVSIHQPSSAIFLRLDQVLLLSEGSRVYFGPPGEMGSFFAQCGFPCPEHTNIADHVLDVISDSKSRGSMRQHGLEQGPESLAGPSPPASIRASFRAAQRVGGGGGGEVGRPPGGGRRLPAHGLGGADLTLAVFHGRTSAPRSSEATLICLMPPEHFHGSHLR